MKLYHYTSVSNFVQILCTGYIRRTHSSLLSARKEDMKMDKYHNLTDPTDNYYPVVWLTSSPVANDRLLGNGKGLYRKDEVRISFEKAEDMFRWTRWAEEHNTEREIFQYLKKSSPDSKNWYVCEREIRIDEIQQVEVNGKEVTDLKAWIMQFKDNPPFVFAHEIAVDLFENEGYKYSDELTTEMIPAINKYFNEKYLQPFLDSH